MALGFFNLSQREVKNENVQKLSPTSAIWKHQQLCLILQQISYKHILHFEGKVL